MSARWWREGSRRRERHTARTIAVEETAMSRFIRLLAPLTITGALVSATFFACGARPGAPGEMPPMAPRPAPADPSGAPSAPGGMPNPSNGSGGLGPTSTRGDGSAAPAPGPISVREIPTPTLSPSAEAYGNASKNQPPPRDAGTGDAYAPPLPPIPDASVPLDGRIEPRGEPSWPPQDPQWPSFPH
jgi:hypothetical protein